MKVSKEQAAQNRAKLIETAARLMRERGIDGVGVAEIGKAAGLTHGALYAHFPSKDALAAEALAFGLELGHRRLTAPRNGRLPELGELLDGYLSEEKRNDIADGCAMAASVSEIGRQDVSVGERFAEGFEQMVSVFASKLGDQQADTTRREHAVTMTVAMIGAVSASRAVMKARPDLADEILHAVRHSINAIAAHPCGETQADTADEPTTVPAPTPSA
ncbi:TetR/AcrR family transcriptional regulator [Paraburkholderia edwinii]|jgi:TetR/AcrR family transcriptional repressor of nem operon|uniref:TetR/AcrR family transcriptional regulator n=1 Tax=Paraburkholderia edwinii TaxID=2861782 RepID=A0ABX8UMF1_9BURK|nr:TetR/AcrR family transcriptional regulator [Paraburkholderia edwinii]QYD69796.1 TetR/AcrR family transcriptional regulator [Paraburkholderia edwinii]